MKKTSLLALTSLTLLTTATGFAQPWTVDAITGSAPGFITEFYSTGSSPTYIKNSQIYDYGTSLIFGGYTNPIGAEYISFQKNQNSLSNSLINNNYNTVAASAAYSALANGPSINMQAFSTAYTTSGINVQGAVGLIGSGTGMTQMNLGTSTSTPLTFWTSNTQQMMLNASGQLILGAGATTPLSGEMISVQKNQNTATSIRLNNTTSSTAASVNYIATGPNSAIAMSAYSSGYSSSGIAQAGAAVLSSTGSAFNIGCGSSGAPITFWTNNTQHMTLSSVGNLGILNSSPAYQLDVTGHAHVTGFFYSGVMSGNYLQAGYDGSSHSIINSMGTALLVNNNNSQDVSFCAGTGNTGRVLIGALTQKAPGADAMHVAAILQVNGDMVVGAGGASPHANIWVTENNWADFVFDKNYKLMPLNELENFYTTNHHLPNVPTQKDIQEQGNNLGQTDVILLQKVEELTLYVVELQKQVEALKNNKK